MPLIFPRLPPSPARRRPPELLFAADDRPARGALLVLVGQHAATAMAMAFITYVLATAQIAGLDRQGTQSMVAMALLGSGFLVAGLLVITLNLLFQLGTSQRAEQPLNTASSVLHADVTGFVEGRGVAWGMRRVVVQRAALAALEGAEAIAAAVGCSLEAVRGSFDEFNLDIELLHSGPALAWGAASSARATITPENLLDATDDAALDVALRNVSGVLLRHLADRVEVVDGASAGPSVLRLHFEH